MSKAPSIDIGISAEDRANISEALSVMLADSYILYLKTHNFHWNVTGPMFQALHSLFMVQYTELWNALDEIAERIRSLGFHAPGTYKEFMSRTSIKESEGVLMAEAMVSELVIGQEAVARSARATLKVADDADDQATVDLMVQRLQVHEKNAWMLRSLLDNNPAQPIPAPKPKRKKK